MGADRGDDTEAGKLPGVQWHGLCIQYGQMGVIARRVRSVGGLARAVGEWLGCGVWGAAAGAPLSSEPSLARQACDKAGRSFALQHVGSEHEE